MAIKMQKQPRVVVSFFGDGAVEEGVFHESVNFASLRKLPIVFVCENNDFAIHSRLDARQPHGDICGLARAHGVPAERIPDMDILKIREKVAQAVEEIRGGKSGPRFFECACYRWMEHVGPFEDYNYGYRTKEELEPWTANDQVKLLGAKIEERTRKKIEQEVEQEIRDAFEYAEKSPFPDAGELYTDMLS
jgi:TPP-dependent pyruvate/acetoin dehydrogenase alpha subunit